MINYRVNKVLKYQCLNSTALIHNWSALLSAHLLAVLQHALLGLHAALGSRRVRFPAAGLNIDVHVELAAEHCHLRLSHREPGPRVGCEGLQSKAKGRQKINECNQSLGQ